MSVKRKRRIQLSWHGPLPEPKCRRCGPVADYALMVKNNSEKYGYGSFCKPCWRIVRCEYNWRRIGINPEFTYESYLAMLSFQHGKCALCPHKPPMYDPLGTNPSRDKYQLVPDHDHKTGEVRALLCSHCNSLLGVFNDDPEKLRRAADYLENASPSTFGLTPLTVQKDSYKYVQFN